jgi:hypothetical protein
VKWPQHASIPESHYATPVIITHEEREYYTLSSKSIIIDKSITVNEPYIRGALEDSWNQDAVNK